MPSDTPDYSILNDEEYIDQCINQHISRFTGKKYKTDKLERVPDGISCVEHYLNAARVPRTPRTWSGNQIAHVAMYKFAYLDDEISKYPEKFIEAHLNNIFPNTIPTLNNNSDFRNAMTHFYEVHHDKIPALKCETDKFYGEEDEKNVKRLSCLEEIIDRDSFSYLTYPYTKDDLSSEVCHISEKSSKADTSTEYALVTCFEKIIDQGLHRGVEGFKYKKYAYSENILNYLFHMVPRKGTESEIVDILISRPRISSTNKSSYLDMILSEESDSSVYKDGSQEGKNKKQFNPSKRQIAIDYISGMIERNQELESVAKLSSGEITCDGIKNNARMNCLLK